MTTKTFVWIGVFIGSSIGGYVPTLFNHDILSVGPVIGSFIGGLIGIYVGYKVGQYLVG